MHAIHYCLQKDARMSGCGVQGVSSRVQGVSSKLSSPPRSGINPCLTQAVMTNACWGLSAPWGTNLWFLLLQVYTFALNVPDKQCFSGSKSLWGWMLGCLWWVMGAGCPLQHLYVPGRDGRSWHGVPAGYTYEQGGKHVNTLNANNSKGCWVGMRKVTKMTMSLGVA